MKMLIFFALAALSGLTWLAYKDHAAYARLVPVLVVGAILSAKSEVQNMEQLPAELHSSGWPV